MENQGADGAVADLNRRRAIKAGVAGVGAAVIWAEPTIKGLARRPAYAAGGSTAVTEQVEIMFTISGTGSSRMITNITPMPASVGGTALVFTVTGTNNPLFINLGNGLTWDTNTTNYSDPSNVIRENQSNSTQLRVRNNSNAPNGTYTVTIDVTCPALV